MNDEIREFSNLIKTVDGSAGYWKFSSEEDERDCIDMYCDKEMAIAILTNLGYTHDQANNIWVSSSGKCKVRVK